MPVRVAGEREPRRLRHAEPTESAASRITKRFSRSASAWPIASPACPAPTTATSYRISFMTALSLRGSRRLAIGGPHTREGVDASWDWTSISQLPVEVRQNVCAFSCVRDCGADRSDQGSDASLCSRFTRAGQLGYEKHEVTECEVGGACEVDRVAGSSQVAPELGEVRLTPEPGVGGEEHERLLEAGDGHLAEERPVHVEAGVEPMVDEHRRRRCGASEGVAEHPDVVEVQHSGERACSGTAVETRQPVKHVPGVG